MDTIHSITGLLFTPYKDRCIRDFPRLPRNHKLPTASTVAPVSFLKALRESMWGREPLNEVSWEELTALIQSRGKGIGCLFLFSNTLQDILDQAKLSQPRKLFT